MPPSSATAFTGDRPILRGCEIVCVGLSEWVPELPTNQHHLMSRMARGNRVLFIESLGLRRPQLAVSDMQRIRSRLGRGLLGVQHQGDVDVLSPFAFPFHGSTAVRAANRLLLRRQVSDAVSRLGFHRPVLWSYVPQAESLIELLDPSLVVYHCVDDLAAQKGVHAESFRAAEKRFAGRADVVLASAPLLAERLGEVSDHVIHAPNVADVEFFATALEKGPVDAAVAALSTPRVVFTGAIVATKLDIEWLTALARLRPHWSFALVGPVGFGDPRTDVSALHAEPNIHLLGGRPYDALPEVLRGADAALIPYALNDLTSSVFPMKVYEYIAAGLPIVSTRLPALRDVAEVTLTDSPQRAAEALARLMAENTDARRRERSRSAVGHSWTDRLAEIASVVNQAVGVPAPSWSAGDLVVDLEHA